MASLAVTTFSRASHAVELSSTSSRHVAGSVYAIAAVGDRAPQSTTAQPAYQGSEVSVGETPSATPSGSSMTLTSILPGFLFVFAGGLPALDLDGDLAQYFLDGDDDGDGIEDVFETGTVFFVSSTNTGTSPVSADSDGNGFSDGAEVLAGSDPNDNASTPGVPQVPILVGPCGS